MLVAAHPSDLRAARDAGLMTGYVARPLERGPERGPTESRTASSTSPPTTSSTLLPNSAHEHRRDPARCGACSPSGLIGILVPLVPGTILVFAAIAVWAFVEDHDRLGDPRSVATAILAAACW